MQVYIKIYINIYDRKYHKKPPWFGLPAGFSQRVWQLTLIQMAA